MQMVAIRAYVLRVITGLMLAVVCVTSVANDYRGQKYYRYTNEEGVVVMSNSVPKALIDNGYEIVTITGRVLEVIEPALDPSILKAREQERTEAKRIAEWDQELRRRYSSVADIENARERKVANLEVNLSILRNNISSIDKQIIKQQEKAARIERSGKEVPESLLSNLDTLAAKRGDLQEQVAQREQEKTDLIEKYNRDMERFSTINDRDATTTD